MLTFHSHMDRNIDRANTVSCYKRKKTAIKSGHGTSRYDRACNGFSKINQEIRKIKEIGMN